MLYPKPLSPKSLARLYAEAGLKEEQIDFLHTFFSACANLYGVVFAEDAWSVYRELSSKTETPHILRRNMYAALEIMRREDLSFYVFEADEVYSKEPRRDGARIIVLRELVGPSYVKFRELYKVEESSYGKPFYVPENLLSFTAPQETPQEQALLRMLNGLRSTCSEYTDAFGKTRNCPYKGKYLREFSYINEYNSFELSLLRGEIEGRKGNPKKAAELEAKLNSVTAARYLVDNIKRNNNVGTKYAADLFKSFFDDLRAMGVVLSNDGQPNELLNAITETCNNQHIWRNHGWTPNELSARMRYGGTPTISFGPGMQKAFADGSMDKDEISRILRAMGFKIE